MCSWDRRRLAASGRTRSRGIRTGLIGITTTMPRRSGTLRDFRRTHVQVFALFERENEERGEKGKCGVGDRWKVSVNGVLSNP